MPVKVYRPDVEKRAAERGIPFELLSDVWKHSYGGGWWEADTRHPAYPRHLKPGVSPQATKRQRRLPRVAVGDLVETMLTWCGITKELVQRLTRTKDCGCKARQRWLNRWGFDKQEKIERLLNKAARWYGIS